MKILQLMFVSASVAALGCAGKSPAIKPTPLPPPPALTCPADIATISHAGQPLPTVPYDTPSPRDGQEPVRTSCAPASESEFPNGPTSVMCQAVDGVSRVGSCTFLVVVTPIPTLQRTKFLAFGDSLTESKPSGIVRVPTGIFNAPGSYPSRLEEKLTARYQDQQIEMIADGWGGENAADQGTAHLGGETSFKDDLSRFSPQVVLLLEGTNDLLAVHDLALFDSEINRVIDGLRGMTRDAKVRGVQVFVASIPPIPFNPISGDAVQRLNARIKSMSIEEHVPFVDLFAVVPLALMGSDGKHPKPEGYDAIATEWLKAIIETLETPEPSA